MIPAIIKVVNSPEIQKVAELAQRIWREHYIPIVGAAQVDYMLEKFQSVLAITKQIREGALYYLIHDEKEDVGYFCVVPKPETEELFLSKFYVRKADRGKGYGGKAIDFITTLARKRHLKKISLTVNKKNQDAIRIYEKMEFEIKEGVVTDIGSGFFMDDYRMEKEMKPRLGTYSNMEKDFKNEYTK